MTIAKAWTAVGAAVIAAATVAALGLVNTSVAHSESSSARGGTRVQTCNNPILAKGMSEWGTLRGSSPTRRPVSDHIVAAYAYVQADNDVISPAFYLPQQQVLAGQQWQFAYDAATSHPGKARVEVDWYSTSEGDNSGFLGHDNGPWVETLGGRRWIRVEGTFRAPGGAIRANVLSSHEYETKGSTVYGTSCSYELLTEEQQPPATPEARASSMTTPPTTESLPSTQAAPTMTMEPPRPAPDSAAAKFQWGMSLPESDEFDYTGPPDTSKWNVAGECWAGHNGNGWRCASRSTVQNGYLRQVGSATGDTGWLGSKRGQRYGRWEVRARSAADGPSNGRQYHPVLITWPDSNNWPAGAEYDYLENGAPGEPCAEAFLHYPNHQPKRQEFVRKCAVDLSQWHNFGFEWAPSHVKGYIDGVEWFTYSSGCIQCAPGPMHQTIQLDNFFGDSMQPAHFDVDWARVYAISGVTQ
jgi:hypothetical protein